MCDSDRDEIERRLREIEKIGIKFMAARYRTAVEIRDMVDQAGDDDEISSGLAEVDREHCKNWGIHGSGVLCQPYRLSLLVRHKTSFDDWPEIFKELAQQTIEATKKEFEAVTKEQEVPLRLRLLFESMHRTITTLAEGFDWEHEMVAEFLKLQDPPEL